MSSQTKKKDRRAEILSAAVTCFAGKGYYETTMDDVVRESGLSKGALYWYFDSKRALFRALLEEWFAEILSHMQAPLSSDLPANTKLEALVQSLKSAAALKPELFRAQLEFFALSMRDDDIKSWLAENYSGQHEFIEALLEQGIASGVFRPVPVAETARLIMGYLDGVFLHAEINNTTHDIPELLDEVSATLRALLEA